MACESLSSVYSSPGEKIGYKLAECRIIELYFFGV